MTKKNEATTTVGKLVDLYTKIKYVEDIVVRAGDIHPFARFADEVAELIKMNVRTLLADAFRVHQPKARVDVKIKGNDQTLVFAGGNHPVGQLKLVPFPKAVNVAVEGKGKQSNVGIEIKVLGPDGVTYVATVQSMGIGKFDRSKTKPLEKTLVAPYWLIRCVQDKNMANMRKATIACIMTTVAGDETTSQRVTLPILQNVKALEEGDELVLFVEPVVPKAIMPVQKLQGVTRPVQKLQGAKKRPEAALGRMQNAKRAKKG